MSHFKLLPLVAVLLITIYPIITRACSCLDTTFQEQYCEAEIVIRINVKSKARIMIFDYGKEKMRRATQEEIENDLDYQGDMYKRYRYKTRQVVTGSKPKSRYVYTLYHSNMCGGLSLAMDKYIIMGSTRTINKKETLEYGSCSYVRKWKDLDTPTRNKIKKRQFNCIL